MNAARLIDRRTAICRLSAVAAAAVGPSFHTASAADGPLITTMGLVIYNCSLRRTWLRQTDPSADLFEPLRFLQHCRALGAGGMQANLGVLEPQPIRQLREFAAQHQLFIEAIVQPPQDNRDLERFEAEIMTARDVGVPAVRTVIMPGRRYERFASLTEFREFEQRGTKMLELAAPIVERHEVPLAVENHKDQRIDERISLLQHLSSEWIGACVDTGNSVALLDDPYDTVAALAPYACSVHLKDQALQEYDDGFLLGDIPLGQGAFDLKRMVETIRQAKPSVRFTLELITRDALKVPCLSEAFWSTLPAVPATDLARTMRFVRQHAAKNLQQVSTLPLEQQVQLEDANISASLAYAGSRLNLY